MENVFNSTLHVVEVMIAGYPSHDLFWSSISFPLLQGLGDRFEVRSQFGKGLPYVNVAGRVCKLQTVFGLPDIFLRR